MSSDDKKILCILPICCYPTNNGSNSGSERINQYVTGLNKLFEYNDIFKKHSVDIFIADNSIRDGDNLPREILNILPSNVRIITCLQNNFGSKNKGAGLIEQWIYFKDIIEKYDWLIHFEPRQLLLNFNFINNVLENPRNLFTLGNDKKHFNTGLFTLETRILLDYCKKVNLNNMVNKYISIENDLYKYIIDHNHKFNLCEKMELLWHDIHTNIIYSM